LRAEKFLGQVCLRASQAVVFAAAVIAVAAPNKRTSSGSGRVS
jgi:hypothetical protein